MVMEKDSTVVVGSPGGIASGVSIGDLTNINGTLFFEVTDPAAGTQLWKSDGTSTGTVMLTDADPSNGGLSISNLFGLSTQGPTITSITATTALGATDLNVGALVTITANISEAVTVTGTPLLTLNNGEVATYFKGSGSNALTFLYTVLPNDDVPDLQVTGINLNGGTIQDANSNDLTGSAQADLNLQIDTDTSERTALSVLINNGQSIALAASAVPFTIAGLETDDNGTLTFSDTINHVTVRIVNGQAVDSQNNPISTVNLSSLLDDVAITSNLSVSDPAGNLFGVAGNVVMVDQDTSEQAALKLTVTNSDIGVEAATVVSFAVAGIHSEDTGTVTFTDSNGKTVQVNINGSRSTYTANLTSLADGPITSSLSVNPDPSGNALTPVAGNSVTLDQDSGEQAALKLTVSNTDVGAGAASAVPFTIAGLDPEDTGTVTFTDANNKTVVVSVNGGQTNYTANLTTLADGTISSSLAVNTDNAGNSFTPVAGTTVTLDRDAGEQAALKLTVNGGQPIGAATAGATPFTIVGTQSDDTGTVSFSDGSHAPVVINIVNGVPSATTANLAGLNDGTITATLNLNTDPASNSFTNVVTTATLDQDKIAETPTVTAPSALTVAAGRSVPLGIVISAVDSDDVISVSISGVPSFESVTAAGVTPTITQHGGLFTYTFNALPVADWNNGLILNSTYSGKGHPTNPLTVTVSNLKAGESSTAPAKTITVTDLPAASTIGTSDRNQFEPSTFGDLYGNDTIATLMASDGPYAANLALLGQYMAASFAEPSDGHGGALISELPPSQQQQFLTHPQT